MKALIVYAHPEPGSYNGAMKDTAVKVLTERGHAVRVSDLYAMHFDPVVEPSQFSERSNPAFFSLQKEQRHAAAVGAITADVAAEQEKLFWADLIIFQFPLWWGSMPAIMKGWVDRVFFAGTIYGRESSGLQGRKALLAVTASNYGDPQEGTRHVKASLSHVTDNMLALAKLDVLEPFFVFGPGSSSPVERAEQLQQYERYLVKISGEM